MASPHHSLPSPSISDVMNLLSVMKRQNEEILTKLNSIEDDNRKLRQELLEIKSSQKFNHYSSDTVSRKRDEPEDEAEHKNEPSNSNKKARVSVANLPPEPEPEPELGQVVEHPASFNTLDDDCLGNVLDFVGKKCYSVFGRVNKRCHEMFCSKGYPKITYLCGYAPLRLIQQHEINYSDLSKGVLHYNRRDILEWLLTNESNLGQKRLGWFCFDAIEESRLGILREVFGRANGQQLEILRDCKRGVDLCAKAAEFGKLECLKFLRDNECEWSGWTWWEAKRKGHNHILKYLRNNGYPTYWQN